MAVKNSTILEKAWLEGSNDFQQRIPNPAISGYAATVNALFEPYNNDLFNAFTGLLNGLNQTYVEGKVFRNPLRVLMKPSGLFGTTERHVCVRWMQSHTALPSSECLLKLELPEFREWFYSVNAPRRYEFSWPRWELQRAFAEDGYGYNDLLARTLDQQISSNEYDQMNIMIQMFAEADHRLGNGLFRHHLSAAPTTKSTAEELAIAIRSYAGRMKFPTQLYNHIDVATTETPETLVLWLTPEVDAVFDIAWMANVFNMDIAQLNYRKVIIPEFPLKNVYAALTSEDFIYCREIGYGVEPPFYNPEQRAYKYYLFDSEMIGINPVANCVLFTTEAATNIPTVTFTPSGFAFSPDSGYIVPGEPLQLHYALQGSISNDSEGLIEVQPDSATFTIAGVDSNSDPISLNSRTYVDDYGVLHTQKSLSSGDVLTITATAAYVNPGGATTTYTDDFTATVA